MVTKAEPRKRPGKVSGRWQFQCNEDKRTSRSTGSYFFKVFLLVSAVWAYIDSSSSISCIDDHHTITVLVTWEYYYFDLNCLHTFIAPAGSAFQTEKCRLASPSVTNERRENHSRVRNKLWYCSSTHHSVMRPPTRSDEITKSIWDLTEFRKLGPLASWMIAHSKKVSEKVSENFYHQWKWGQITTNTMTSTDFWFKV